jgi:hypothetical protein
VTSRPARGSSPRGSPLARRSIRFSTLASLGGLAGRPAPRPAPWDGRRVRTDA